MTMSEPPAPFWGNLLKSNSNGTYFGTSLENVNRNEYRFVDFEKMVGLDGIALVDIVSNPEQVVLSGKKALQSRITHNDGMCWHLKLTSLLTYRFREHLDTSQSSVSQFPGKRQGTVRLSAIHHYQWLNIVDHLTCRNVNYIFTDIWRDMTLELHIAVHLSRWPLEMSPRLLQHPLTQTHSSVAMPASHGRKSIKDAHMWEFGDSGSVLVMVNDEQPTTFVLFSTDEGLTWWEHPSHFSDHPLRVSVIITVPMDITSRKFILPGDYPKSPGSTAVHLDFSALTSRKCKSYLCILMRMYDITEHLVGAINVDDPGKDDFELWSPSEGRPERCLFGRQVRHLNINLCSLLNLLLDALPS